MADVNGDGKPDVVAVANDAVVWYENPTWAKHDVIRGATEKDNVCLQARDVDGDGRVDFALGASWQPSNTKTGGTLQLLTRTGAPGGYLADRPARLRADPAPDPVRRRPRDRQAAARRRPAPGTRDEGAGLGSGQRRPPDGPLDPARPVRRPLADRGGRRHACTPSTTSSSSTSTATARMRSSRRPGKASSCSDATRRVTGRRRSSGRGTRTSQPNKGASEVKVGRLRDGKRYIATIEPWHGFQVVVYTPPKSGEGLWDRRVIDEPVKWGHAVWCADLDGDGDDETDHRPARPERPGRADAQRARRLRLRPQSRAPSRSPSSAT